MHSWISLLYWITQISGSIETNALNPVCRGGQVSVDKLYRTRSGAIDENIQKLEFVAQTLLSLAFITNRGSATIVGLETVSRCWDRKDAPWHPVWTILFVETRVVSLILKISVAEENGSKKKASSKPKADFSHLNPASRDYVGYSSLLPREKQPR